MRLMESIIFYKLMKNYKIISIPKYLTYYMDSYCLNVIVRLINFSDNKQQTTFKISNEYLQQLTGYSKKVLNATLSGLHRKGIITVVCDGQGKGKQQNTNTITINTDKFEEYDTIFPSIENIYDQDIRVTIDKYREKGWKVSYLSEEDAETPKQIVNNKLEQSQKEENKSETVQEEKKTDSLYNSIFISDDDMDNPNCEKEEINITATAAPSDRHKVTLSADTATAEEIVEDARKRGYVITGIKDSTVRGFELENVLALRGMQSDYGWFSPELKTEMFKYCKQMKY